MPIVEANGLSVNYCLEGPESGDLVVIISGLCDVLESWSNQAKALVESGYRVLRYDNRGIGGTSSPAGPYNAEIMADDLYFLLHALHVTEAFHLVGISMGGMIAQSFALKYPNAGHEGKFEVRTLSLCCTYAEPTEFLSKMFESWAEMSRQMGVSAVMQQVILWAFTLPFFRTRQEECRQIEEGVEKLQLSSETYLNHLSVVQHFDSTAQLAGLGSDAGGKGLGGLDGERVMVLAGRTDILVPVQLSRELSEKIEGSRFVTAKGGHCCMLEFPDSFNKALVEFLDEWKGR